MMLHSSCHLIPLCSTYLIQNFLLFQIMAIGTLALCYNNIEVFRGVVKMRRGKLKIFSIPLLCHMNSMNSSLQKGQCCIVIFSFSSRYCKWLLTFWNLDTASPSSFLSSCRKIWTNSNIKLVLLFLHVWV